MKDFQLRNDTKLLLRNDPTADLAALTAGKRVLFVYGGGSAKRNGCYDDVKHAAEGAGGVLYELGGASRELARIEEGIRLVKEHDIELVISAGGANIMDCAKLTAFGAFHEADLWAYVKGEKNPYGEEKLPLILMPTYPMSVHLGLHWSMILGILRKMTESKKASAVRTWILRALALAVSGFGVCAFFRNHITDYLFLRSHFVFFDMEQPLAAFLAEYVAMMTFWACVGFYGAKALQKCTVKKHW